MTRRGWVALAALAGLVAATVVVAHHRDGVARTHRLDAASRAMVLVWLVPVPLSMIVAAPATDETTGLLALVNQGRVREQVTSLQVLSPGWARQAVDIALPAGALVAVPLRLQGSCGPALLREEPLRARISVRTPRGLTTDRVVELPGPAGDLLRVARDRCHVQPTANALQVQSHNDADPLRGRALALSLGLVNAGGVPLRLSHLRTSPGFAVTSSRPFPLVLPPQTGTVQRPLDVVLGLQVADCRRARAELAAAAAGTPGDIAPGVIVWDLLGATGPAGFTQSTDDYLRRMMTRSCGVPAGA